MADRDRGIGGGAKLAPRKDSEWVWRDRHVDHDHALRRRAVSPSLTPECSARRSVLGARRWALGEPVGACHFLSVAVASLPTHAFLVMEAIIVGAGSSGVLHALALRA